MSRARAIVIAAIVSLTLGSLALGVRTTLSHTEAGPSNASVAEILSSPATTGSSPAAVEQMSSPVRANQPTDADDGEGGAHRISETVGRTQVEDD
jgi:hypothetical protein